jgi:hypothetical protein
VAGASGAIYNVQFTFSTPGVKTFGFQLNDGTDDRTYYIDGAGNHYFWGDISNNGAPAVTVTADEV